MTDPYLPPQSPLAATESIDLALAFKSVTADPNWIRTCALVGVSFFVPIIGQMLHMGWQCRVFGQMRDGGGDTLPTVEFIDDIQLGIAPFVAILNLAVPAGVLVSLTIVPGAIMNSIGEGGALSVVGMLLSVVGFMLLTVINLVSIAVVPELLRRGLKGEMTPLLSFGPSIAAIRARPSQYATVALGIFLAQMLGGLGVMACYVGLIITAPAGLIVAAHIISQWDALVAPHHPAPAQ